MNSLLPDDTPAPRSDMLVAQSIDDLAARIKGRGGVLDAEPFSLAGKRAFRLRDPDGFRFTVSSPRETP